MKTTEEAREYFKPLTYEDLTEKNFNKLVAILKEELGKWNKVVLDEKTNDISSSKYYMTIYLHKKYGKYPGTRFVEKPYKEAFIIVECDRYSKREGISFNKDGFIGFAGWADSENIKPFLNAFEKWVNKIKLEKANNSSKIDVSIKPNDLNKFYYVTEFPTNPEKGMIIIKDGIEYIYIEKWCPLDTAENKLSQITELFNKLDGEEFKQGVKEIIYG